MKLFNDKIFKNILIFFIAYRSCIALNENQIRNVVVGISKVICH